MLLISVPTSWFTNFNLPITLFLIIGLTILICHKRTSLLLKSALSIITKNLGTDFAVIENYLVHLTTTKDTGIIGLLGGDLQPLVHVNVLGEHYPSISEFKKYRKYKIYYYPYTKVCVKYEETDFNKGCDLLDSKNYKQAISYFDKEILQYPKYHFAYICKAAALIGLKKYDEALIDSNQSIKINPEFIETYKYKLVALLGLENFEESLDCMDKIFGIDSNLASDDYVISKITWAHMNKFKIRLFEYIDKLLTSNSFEQALQTLDRMENFFENDGNLYYQKGNVFYALSDYTNAHKNYDLATLYLKPTHNHYMNAQLQKDTCTKLLNQPITRTDTITNTSSATQNFSHDIENTEATNSISESMFQRALLMLIPGIIFKGMTPSSFRSDAVIGFLGNLFTFLLGLFFIAGVIAFLLNKIISKYFYVRMKKDSKKTYTIILILSILIADMVSSVHPHAILCAASDMLSFDIRSEFAMKQGYITKVYENTKGMDYIYIQPTWETDSIQIYITGEDAPKIYEFIEGRKYKIYYYPHTRICVKYELYKLSYFDKAYKLLINEKYEESIHIFNQEIKNNPNKPYAYVAKSAALLELEKYEETIECCDKAIKIKRRLPEAYEYKCRALLSLKRYEEAKECLRLLPRPFDNDLYVISQPSHEDIEHLQELVEEGIISSSLSDSISTESSSPINRHTGNTYTKKGPEEDSTESINISNDIENIQKNIMVLDKLIDKDIDLANNYFKKGNLLYSLKDYEKAYDTYRYATIFLDKSDEYYAQAHYNKSLCAALLNRPTYAAGALKVAIEADKKYKDLAEKEKIFDSVRDSTYFKWLWDQLK